MVGSKQCHQQTMVEDCVAALTALYSGGRVESVNYVSEDSVSLSQTAMLDHIYNSVCKFGAPTNELSGAGALQ